MKKKLLVTMLTLAMAGSLMACAGKEGAAPASEAKTETQADAKAEDAKAEDTKAEQAGAAGAGAAGGPTPEAGPAPEGFQGDDVVDGDYKEV